MLWTIKCLSDRFHLSLAAHNAIGTRSERSFQSLFHGLSSLSLKVMNNAFDIITSLVSQFLVLL